MNEIEIRQRDCLPADRRAACFPTMNASISKTEEPESSSSSSQDTDFSVVGKRSFGAGSLKGVGVLLGIFLLMAGISWFVLSWLAGLHDRGLLFNETTVNTVMASAVVIAIIVIVPFIVRLVRSVRANIEKGVGILSTASNYLDSNTQNPLLTKTDFRTSFSHGLVGLLTGSKKSRSDEASGASEDLPQEPETELDIEALSTTHREASQCIKEFNSEMEELFPRWKQRIGAYEQRVKELERELATKASENGELLRRQIELVNQHLNLARKQADDETEFEVKPQPASAPVPELNDHLVDYVSPRKPQVNIPEKAAKLTRKFRHDTESLPKADKIKVYEQRIARMEKELAGTEAENKELTWNQLHIMQEKLAKLADSPETGRTAPSAREAVSYDTPSQPKQVAGFKTEIRQQAALRVAELNERLARMYPENSDRIAAYEERLAKIEQDIKTRSAEHLEMLECQMEMAKNYFQLMQGFPEIGQAAPASQETLSQMFGLQFDLNATQQEAARRVAQFNQDLNTSHSSNNEQVEAYRKRVIELESEVEQKDEENKELCEAQLELVRYQLDYLEESSICDQPMNSIEPTPHIDENGVPIVRIPEFRPAAIKEEVPREIRAMLDRKPNALRIQGVTKKKLRHIAN